MHVATRRDHFVDEPARKIDGRRHASGFAPRARVPALRAEATAPWQERSVWISAARTCSRPSSTTTARFASEPSTTSPITRRKPSIDLIGKAIDDVASASKDKSVAAIGIGAPGNVDLATGRRPTIHRTSAGTTCRSARNSASVSARASCVGNDARCAVLGEHTYGTGRGTANFVLLTLGTGIGGGIVAEGTLLLGNLGGAGEFGHHQLRATDGFICNCGKTGCFEAQASGTGLIRHMLALAPSFPRSALAREKPEKFGSKAIRKAAEAGDPHAVAAWNRYVDDLARGLANVIAFVNPEAIALGGGVAAAGDFLLAAVRPRVEELTTMVPRGKTRIVAATLGNDAGAIGAATMARRGGLTTKDG